jgi:hypothetical protein
MAVYGYNTRKTLIGTIGSYIDVIATIEAPEGSEFMVECLSEKDHAIRFYADHVAAKRFGQAFNRKADKQDIMATYQVFALIPFKAGK